MGKSILNSALAKVTGRIDNWVYRRRHGQLIVTKRPDFSEVVPTVGQLAQRERFAQAAAYARTALETAGGRAFYRAAAEKSAATPFAEAVADFLKPPVVSAIETADYHGAIGDLIHVVASDSHGVAAVNVAIRDSAAVVLEQGEAAYASGKWTYVATTALAPDAPVTIVATATDRPGNAAVKTVSFPAP
jgi:hypothetical protein